MMERTVDINDILKAIICYGIPSKWSVHCETNHDENVLGLQIPQSSEIAYEFMSGLGDIANSWRDDHRYSAQACAKAAEKELLDIISSTFIYLSTESVKRLHQEINEWLADQCCEDGIND